MGFAGCVIVRIFNTVDDSTLVAQERGDPGGCQLTKLVSRPEPFLEHCIQNFPSLLPWEVAVVCGVDQWDFKPKSHDSQVDQSHTSLHSLYADYISKLFSAAKESGRLRGMLSSMFKSDTQLLLNTLSVLLRLGQPTASTSSDCDGPR